MAILHYTLGLPPERNGGSLLYAYSLMLVQQKTHQVFALTCGDTLFRKCKSKIKASKNILGVNVYKLSNPLTPTLIYGTSNPIQQHRDIVIDYDSIRSFIIDNNIKIMHLHTLMGLHKDIVEFIKNHGVTIIYTTHDFHGVCPHYNLINYHGELCDKQDSKTCACCNNHEPSDLFLRIVNSPLFHLVKKSGALKFLNRNVISSNSFNVKKTINNVTKEVIDRYEDLIKYYRDYFLLIDKFHFNSSQTQEVFNRFIPDINGEVIPIVTKGISDKRKPLSNEIVIKLGFIGSINEYKGFPMLKQTVLELEKEGFNNFKILVYGSSKIGMDEDTTIIQYQPPYKYSQLSEILYHLDGTLVPSKWYETFSLVTLESLAHGRPVIVSDHVGAKDIVYEYNPNFIFSSQSELKNILKSILLNPKILIKENEKILSQPWKFSMEKHSQDIFSFYYS